MALFKRSSRQQRTKRDAVIAHFTEFVRTRKGVEAYLEPESPREPLSLLLVARDGEFTRRQVPDPRTAAQLATQLGLPFYEVLRTGYPQRMRDWSKKRENNGR